uniref:Uncharacterized protein n=1 Tax=Anopheles funestus TaxID=62324 RepID=A0A182RKY7_ANOFN
MKFNNDLLHSLKEKVLKMAARKRRLAFEAKQRAAMRRLLQERKNEQQRHDHHPYCR